MNLKYNFLKDLEWLREERVKKSRSQLAKEISEKTGHPKRNIEGSMRFIEIKNFSKEVIKTFKQERIYHTNRKKKDKGKV